MTATPASLGIVSTNEVFLSCGRSLTSAVLNTEADDLVGDIAATTGLTRAISNAVREVLVPAEAAGLGGAAAEGGGKTEHVANADALSMLSEDWIIDKRRFAGEDDLHHSRGIPRGKRTERQPWWRQRQGERRRSSSLRLRCSIVGRTGKYGWQDVEGA